MTHMNKREREKKGQKGGKTAWKRKRKCVREKKKK